MSEFQDEYSISQVSEWLRVSWRRLDYWDRQGIVKPSLRAARGPGRGRERRYSFLDLITIKAVLMLRQRGIPAVRLRKALRFLQTRGADSADLLRRGVFVTDGRDLYEIAESKERLINLTSGGQVTFAFALAPLARTVRDSLPSEHRVDRSGPKRAKRSKPGGLTVEARAPDLKRRGGSR